MNNPNLNLRNLDRLIKHLKGIKNENNFSMMQWLRFRWFESLEAKGWDEDSHASDLVNQMENVGDCGTVACLAGHAALLKAADEGNPSGTYQDYDVKYAATEWLGLEGGDEADILFQPRNSYGSIIDFSRKDAIKALEHLRNTGEVRWPRLVRNAGTYARSVDRPPIFKEEVE